MGKSVGIGLILGLVTGLLASTNAVSLGFLDPAGQIFIKLLRMVMVPLVFTSVVLGLAHLQKTADLGRKASFVIIYFLFTTALAICIGLSLALLIEPGGSHQEAARELLKQNQSEAQTILEKARQTRPEPLKFLLDLIPQNPLKALVETELLQLLFFALALGLALRQIPENLRLPVLTVFEGIYQAMIVLVGWILYLAPVCVFALLASAISKMGFSALHVLALYILTVCLGLSLHFMYNLAMLHFATGKGVLRLILDLKDVLILGFSSSSSNATLPVTLKTAQEKMQLNSEDSAFILPLGATINMDGTALYQGVATVFLCQLFQIPLDIYQLIGIVGLATLASIGAAGIPGTGMITLVMVLDFVSPILAAGIALIFCVDRLLDMLRTMANITGDITTVAIVGRIFARKGSEAV